MLIPGTNVEASFYTFSKSEPPLYYGANEGSLVLASVNAGNSDGLCVGLGGVNGGFFTELSNGTKQKNIKLNGCGPNATKDDYQFRHLQLLAKAGKNTVAVETYTSTDPTAFCYVNATRVASSATNWYEGVCFVDVFDAGLCPWDNANNAAMLYMAPPHGGHYSSNADFLAAIQATAVNIIKTIAGYNAIAAQGKLPVIEALRNTLYSSVNYNPQSVDPSEIARAIFAGFQSELQANAPSGLAELQFPVGDSAHPLFGAVETDLKNLLAQPVPPTNVVIHAHVPGALAPPPPPGGGVIVDPGGEGEGEGQGKGAAGSDPGYRYDAVSESDTRALAKAWSYKAQAADVQSKAISASMDIELQLLKTGQPLPANADVVEAPLDPEIELAPREAMNNPVLVSSTYVEVPEFSGSNQSLPEVMNPVQQITPLDQLPRTNAVCTKKCGGIIGAIVAVVIVIGTIVGAVLGTRPKKQASLKINAPDPNTPIPPASTVNVSASVTTADGSTTASEGTVAFTLTDSSNKTVGTPLSVSVTSGAASGTLTAPTIPGSYTLTVEYTDGSDSATATEIVTISAAAPPLPIGTTTSITTPSSQSSVVSGSSLTVGATVAANDNSTLPDTSTVTFTITPTTPTVTSGALTVMSGAVSGSIAIPAATAAGSYTLAATFNDNTSKYAASNATQSLTITAAPGMPTITTNPSNATVVEGGTVTFTAAATPATAPVQWEASSDQGSTFTAMPNQTNTTLTLTGVTAAAMNHNQYRAVFGSGAATATTTAATLTVNRVVFLGTDTATQGNWVGVYGNDKGYEIAGVAAGVNPSYATVAVPTAQTFAYASNSTTDPRALQDPAGVATVRYADTYIPATPGQPFSVTVTASDNSPHQIALYIVDWDTTNTRSESVVLSDPTSNAVLDSQTFTNFSNGEYAIWNFSGSLTITFTESKTGLADPTLFGIFFDPYNPKPSHALHAAAAIVTAGKSANTNSRVTVIPANGFSAPVTLTAGSWPNGITPKFAAGAEKGSATVTISVDAAVSQGLYLLPVTGTSGSASTTTIIPLGVNPPPMPLVTHCLLAARVTTGEAAAADVLAQADSFYDKDPTSVVLVGLQNLGLTTAPPAALLSKNGKSLRVDGEGIWMVDDTKGMIAFVPEATLTHPPTPAGFQFSDAKGNKSNTALVIIDPGLSELAKVPAGLKKMTDADFWKRLQKEMIDDPSPALDSDAIVTTLIALAGSLQLVVTPGPDPVKQADYEAHYQQWDAGGQMLQDLLDISRSMVDKIFDSSAPPLLARFWCLALMLRMAMQARS